ncbi:glyoxylate/hydroxypyruvate reductase A [Flavobacteriaceae bacterium KMM 6897]|nr:glyoxylate/hydroxypyruvate reductase A [Flavobacteriaceae bacterium KMM 6897]
MAIVVIREDGKASHWKDILQNESPDVPIFEFGEEHPKEAITMALVWQHPKDSLKQYPNLKCVASMGAGVDFIMADPNVSKLMTITRVVDPMLASDMSEFVVASIFAHLKNLSFYGRQELQKSWTRIEYLRKKDVTIGIMGLGELGRTLAKDLQHLGFQVQGWANSKKEGITTFIDQKELPLFLASTSILVCLLPLTGETKNILNKDLFRKLPKDAYVINVARGGHLVETDLLHMVNSGHLSGASLDVFSQEPLPEDHPFWGHPKINITPHIASISSPSSIVPQILENYGRLTLGKQLMNVVSVSKGY